MSTSLKATAKKALRATLPVAVRKQLAAWLGQQSWLSAPRRYWWIQELLRDLERHDTNAYHKFLWRHHLAYAESYSASRFGYRNLDASRTLLFSDLEQALLGMGLRRESDIRSVFEVGCSLGYLLRYMEESFFPSARSLAGIDIDRRAIAEGSSYLQEHGSIVELGCSDMESLADVLGQSSHDVVAGLGVLMYLQEGEASRVLRCMLQHTNTLLVLSGLAHPTIDNCELPASTTRESDGTFVHNFDAMVRSAGGEVVFRRWEGAKLLDGHSIYFVFATPACPRPGER